MTPEGRAIRIKSGLSRASLPRSLRSTSADLVPADMRSHVFTYRRPLRMFSCTPRVRHAGRFRLYHAESLLGPWKEHPCSPVIEPDPRIAGPPDASSLGRRVSPLHPGLRDTSTAARVRAFWISILDAVEYREQRPSGPILGLGQDE